LTGDTAGHTLTTEHRPPGAADSRARDQLRLFDPQNVAVDPRNGDRYIVDTDNSEVEQVTPAGTSSVVAGTGQSGPPAPGPATSSQLDDPDGVAVDPRSGNLYIAATDNSEIEQVTPAGILSIVAGTGADQSGSPTPGPATRSELDTPLDVAVDPRTGDLYITDTFSSEIVQVTSAGILSIGTGSDGPPTPGPATNSDLSYPLGVAGNPRTGDFYIADGVNDEIEQVTPAGTLSIVAGTGTGTVGRPTPEPATSSDLFEPGAVAVDRRTDDLYIADSNNQKIERVGAPPPPASADVAFQFPAGDPTSVWDRQTFTEKLTVNNDGPDATPTVSAIAVNLPPESSGLTVTDLHGGKLINGQVSWKIPRLDLGDTVTHAITFKFAKHARGQVQLTEFTAVPSNDPNSSNNQDAITIHLRRGS
jgi:Domain of unknown function DUF11